jgi:hypothetical protein
MIESLREYPAPSAEEIKRRVERKDMGPSRFTTSMNSGRFGERAILIAQDITKRVELEASLRQSEMRCRCWARSWPASRTRVRNPLFGISSILDAFETRFSDRTEYLRYTNVLRDEIRASHHFDGRTARVRQAVRGETVPVSMEEMIAGRARCCRPRVAQVISKQVEESLPRSGLTAAGFQKYCEPDRERDSTFAAKRP